MSQWSSEHWADPLTPAESTQPLSKELQDAVDSCVNARRLVTSDVTRHRDTSAPDPSGSADIQLCIQVQEAANAGDLAAVIRLCENPSQSTPRYLGGALSNAVRLGRQDMAKYLVSQGAVATVHAAATATENKDHEMLEVLLTAGWDINAETACNTPAALAYAVEDAALTDWFLRHGADPNACCRYLDLTPLSYAMFRAPMATIKKLFDHGGRITAGQLLHHAAWRKLDDRIQVVKYLMDQGARINAVQYEDFPSAYALQKMLALGTPLHYAAERGDLDLVRELIAMGADPSIEDSCGELAADKALREGHRSVCTLLRPLKATGGRALL